MQSKALIKNCIILNILSGKGIAFAPIRLHLLCTGLLRFLHLMSGLIFIQPGSIAQSTLTVLTRP